jgi:hypothetical protein
VSQSLGRTLLVAVMSAIVGALGASAVTSAANGSVRPRVQYATEAQLQQVRAIAKHALSLDSHPATIIFDSYNDRGIICPPPSVKVGVVTTQGVDLPVCSLRVARP